MIHQWSHQIYVAKHLYNKLFTKIPCFRMMMGNVLQCLKEHVHKAA